MAGHVVAAVGEGVAVTPLGKAERWVLVTLCAVAIAICYADRTNISTAILEMQAEYHWNDSTKGLIMSSFYYGYAVVQAPAGYIATKLGGMPCLLVAVALWSFFTLATPPASFSLALLLPTRVLMGLSEGISFPAIHHLISRYVIPSEQTSAIGVVTAASYLGTVIVNYATPLIIGLASWEWSFYIFGSLGLLWVACVFVLGNTRVVRGEDGSCTLAELVRTFMEGRPASSCTDAQGVELGVMEGPEESRRGEPAQLSPRKEEREDADADEEGMKAMHQMEEEEGVEQVERLSGVYAESRAYEWESEPPVVHLQQSEWRIYVDLLLCPQVWAIAINQFCSGWGFYVLLTWIPTFYSEVYDVPTEDLGNLLIVPFIAQGVVGVAVGVVADWLIRRGLNAVVARRYFQVSGMLLSAAFILLLLLLKPTKAIANLLLTLSLASNALTLAGVSAYQLDIAPKYAGFIFGLGNMCSSAAAIVGIQTTGILLEHIGWSPVFVMAFAMFGIGALAWLGLARGHSGPLERFA